MAPRRGIEFNTGQGAGKTLAQVLGVYINAAYPPDGSECSQATRSSLMQLVEKIGRKAAQQQTVNLPRRQLPMLRTAVDWYFSEIQKGMDNIRDALLERLE